MNGFQSDQYGDYIEKRPGDVLDYGFFWESWLKGDTISSSSWSIPSPLVKVSDSHDDNSTAVLISGGSDDSTYTVENTINTSNGLTVIRSFRIVCV